MFLCFYVSLLHTKNLSILNLDSFPMVGLYPLKEAYKVVKPKNENEEPFVTEDETKTSIVNIFTSVGLMVLAIVLGGVLYWSYRKERTLMIVVLSVMVCIYAAVVLILVVVQRKKLDNGYFIALAGSSIFMVVMLILIIITFSIVASRRMSKSYLGTETQDYLSKTTEL